MNTVLARCTYCNEPVDPTSRYVWRRIQGWEKKAGNMGSRRGGSDISLRETLEVFACEQCIVRLKSGLSPGQGSLV